MKYTFPILEGGDAFASNLRNIGLKAKKSGETVSVTVENQVDAALLIEYVAENFDARIKSLHRLDLHYGQ